MSVKHKVISEELKQRILELYPTLGMKGTVDEVHIQYERARKIVVDAGAWIEPRNAPKPITKELKSYPGMDYKQILKDAHRKSVLKAFIQDMCKIYRSNSYKKIAAKYKISVAVVDRIRREVGIPFMSDDSHPGRKLIKKRIRRMYLGEQKSTLYIGKVLRTSSQFVQNMLHEMNITMNPSHCVNPIYFDTRSELSPHQLIKEIKRLYEVEKLPLVEIAEKLGIWEGTVSSKLKAMGIPIVTRRRMKTGFTIKPCYNIKGIYEDTHDPYVIWFFSGANYVFVGARTPKGKRGKCLWCNLPFISNISVGPRAQKFCNPKCKNKAKDLRRILVPRVLKGKLRAVSWGRFNKLALEFTGNIEKLGLPDDVKKKVMEVRQNVDVPKSNGQSESPVRRKQSTFTGID